MAVIVAWYVVGFIGAFLWMKRANDFGDALVGAFLYGMMGPWWWWLIVYSAFSRWWTRRLW